MGVTGTTSRTKLVLGGGSVLAVLLAGTVMQHMRRSSAAESSAGTSSELALADPNSPAGFAPTQASNPAPSGSAGPCGCGDIPTVEERIQEAHAVIPLYQAEISRLQASGSTPPYSSQQYNQFQATLQPVLNALATTNHISTFADGDTSMFCNVTTDQKANSCMKASTATHEGIHQAVCNQYGWSISSGTWKKQIGLIAVYQNEIVAYQAEIDFLQPLVASLKQSCGGGWTGSITSTFKYHDDQGTVGGTVATFDRSQTDKWKFSGLLGYIPQETQGTWSGELTMEHHTVTDSSYTWSGDPLTGRCKGTVLKNHSELRDMSAGSGSGHADLMITIITGSVAHISVLANQNDAPGLTNGWHMQQDSNDGAGNLEHGPCKRTSASGSPTPIQGGVEPFLQRGADFDAPVDPQHPGVLKGQLIKNNSDKGTTTIEWDLTRAPASH